MPTRTRRMLAGGPARALESRPVPPTVHLERWADGDHELLAALNGDPEQMAHVGGAESAAKIAERQARYVADPGQFRIVDDATGAGAGWVGFWARAWRGAAVYAIGWAVLAALQGPGHPPPGTAPAPDPAPPPRG